MSDQEQRPQSSGPSISGDINLTNSQNYGRIGHTLNIGQQARTFRGRDLEPLRQRLAKYAGAQVILRCCAGDGESEALALEIAALIVSAGWSTNADDLYYSLWSPTPMGVIIKHPEHTNEAMEELGNGLLALGLKVDGIRDSGEPVVEVMVGRRP